MNVAPGRRARLILKPHGGWTGTLAAAEGLLHAARRRASAVELIAADAPNPSKSASRRDRTLRAVRAAGRTGQTWTRKSPASPRTSKTPRARSRAPTASSPTRGFLAKAPANLVEAEREKLRQAQDKVSKLQARLAEMESLR